jgi:hypothetical protein
MWDLETTVETYAESLALVKGGSTQDQTTVDMCLKEFKRLRVEPTTHFNGRDLYPYYARQYGVPVDR